MSTDPRPRRKSRIAQLVIADDHDLARAGLHTMLTGQGGLELVGEAKNGREALELCRRLQPDLALLDVRMPRMSGPELLVELLDCQPPPNHDTRFIFMSGYADPGVMGQAREGGRHYSFLKKPFSSSGCFGMNSAYHSRISFDRSSGQSMGPAMSV